MNAKPEVFLFLFPLVWFAPRVLAEELPVDHSKTVPESNRTVLGTDHGTPVVGLVTRDRVSLRAGPGFSSEVLLALPQGTRLNVLADQGAWYEVQLPLEVSVYVAKDFLDLENQIGRVKGHRVHVRAGPGQAFSSLGFLENQEIVHVRRVVGDWVEIQPPPSCRGWVNRTYITFLAPEESKDF